MSFPLSVGGDPVLRWKNRETGTRPGALRHRLEALRGGGSASRLHAPSAWALVCFCSLSGELGVGGLLGKEVWIDSVLVRVLQRNGTTRMFTQGEIEIDLL